MKCDSLVKIASMSWMAIGHCSSFYALCLCFCVCHCGLLCSPFLFLFPNKRSGRIQYSYCRKVVPAPAGVSHIDDMCRAQGRGDPVWFIKHHQLLVYLPPAYTSAQTKGNSEIDLRKVCVLQPDFVGWKEISSLKDQKMRNSQHLLICNKSAEMVWNGI